MKLAVSNIAWPTGADAAAAALLRRHGATGVEIAPTMVWPKPLDASRADVLAYRATWERQGLTVVALQALLFGRPDLTLFAGRERREQTFDYLDRIMELAEWLGAGVLVFGSPKNRLIGGRPTAEVMPETVEFFRHVGDRAAKRGVIFGIEPNPPEYGCDFVTTAAEGSALVAAVGHPGFGLHLDAGGLALTGGTPADAGPVRPCHYHISEPHLSLIGTGGAPHAAYAVSLRGLGYDGWRSIEMRRPEGDWEVALDTSLAHAAGSYFPQASAA